MSTYNRIGIVLLSFAHLHQYKWAETFLKDDRIKVLGIWDDDEERGRDAASRFNLSYFPGVEELLSLPGVKGAAVCSEPSRHAALVNECCRKRISVLCEKPLAPTMSDALKIQAAVEASGITFYQSFPQRLIPSNMEIKKILDKGVIGRINHVRKRHGHYFGLENLAKDMPWIVDGKKEGGGAYLDEGIHETDLLQYFFGMPDTVTAVMQNQGSGKVETSGTAIYRFPGNFSAVHEAGWNWQAGGPTTEIYGDRGTIIQNYTDCASNRGRGFRPALTLFRGDTGEWEEIECDFDFSEVHSLPPKEFISILLNKRDPISRVEDGIRSLKMIEAAYRSAELGCTIRLDNRS